MVVFHGFHRFYIIILENDYVKSVKAVKNNHVVYLDSATWYLSGGGLESMAQMVKEVKDGIEK